MCVPHGYTYPYEPWTAVVRTSHLVILVSIFIEHYLQTICLPETLSAQIISKATYMGQVDCHPHINYLKIKLRTFMVRVSCDGASVFLGIVIKAAESMKNKRKFN